MNLFPKIGNGKVVKIHFLKKWFVIYHNCIIFKNFIWNDKKKRLGKNKIKEFEY